ncbi:MAG TPA: DUF1302 domain-containing protein [Pseudomonas sp.]|nr:DUF1302 domain-containing protein [Pseudomonas sp.]
MMTTTNQQLWRLAKLPLAVSLASVLAAPAFAVNFNIGEIEGSFDSSLSVGATWSTTSRDMDLVGNANGGKGYTQTGDDGRLNFNSGETVSKIFKGIHDLELKYKDTGVFVRGKYWYDFELKDEGRRFKDISDSNRKEGAKSAGAQILDAFVYHNYAIADQPGTVRVGKQVVSWGESTFIQNSINSINPVDAAAFRRPGSEIKEALIPVNMFYVSQNLTDQLSMEAFYQLEWDQTILDNCGTFFASNDVAADGCSDNYNILSAEYTNLIKTFGPTLAGLGLDLAYTDEGLMIPRGPDRDARDSGQWGLAFRWLGDNTEYGVYAMNYHSRTPILSMQNTDAATITTAAGLIGSGNPTLALGGAAALVGKGQYFMEYPEDIRLYGASFSTMLPTGTAWQGEISYRPNAPVQINTQAMTLKLATSITEQLATGGPSAALAMAGVENRGYNRKEITQIQSTFTHFFDQVLGAERATVVGEVGFTHVGGLESKDKTRYGRDANFGIKGSLVDPGDTSVAKFGDHGFVTANSWGYRVRAILDYNDVFAGVNLKPNMAFSHDVDGYSPGPVGAFNEGSMAVSFGLDAEYQNMYTASIGYTNFFGGRYNMLTDRDFASMSVGINF